MKTELPIHWFTKCSLIIFLLIIRNDSQADSLFLIRSDNTTEKQIVETDHHNTSAASSCTAVLPVCTPPTINPTGPAFIRQVDFDSIHYAGTTTNDYKDNTCNFHDTVVAGNIYQMHIRTLHLCAVKVWIDYNNDGGFNDSTELIYSSLDSSDYTFWVQTAIVPTLYTSLRMRINTDIRSNHISSTITNACDTPITGQVEDYSLVFIPNALPPVANFTVHDTINGAQGNLAFTDLSQNAPTSWYWSMPGAVPSTSTLRNPVVTYPSLGIYTVSLHVYNGFGDDSIVKTNYINITNFICMTPSSSDTSGVLFDAGGPDNNYLPNEDCSFLIHVLCADSIRLSFSNFHLNNNDKLTIYNGPDPSYPVLLNSGATLQPFSVVSTGSDLFIHFKSSNAVAPGFAAQWNSYISSTTDSINALFSVSDSNPPINTEVHFTDASYYNPVSWQWDFGDGITSSLQYPSHIYKTPGLKTVTLLTRNCNTTAFSTKNITVQELPLISAYHNPVNLSVGCNDALAFDVFLKNSGSGDLVYSIDSIPATAHARILALYDGANKSYELPNTISALSKYLTNYTAYTYPALTATSFNIKDVLLVIDPQYANPVNFIGYSSLIQNFITNGGSVIFCGTTNYQCINNTDLFYITSQHSYHHADLNILQPDNPLMTGVYPPYMGTSMTTDYTLTNSNLNTVADYLGNPVVTYYEQGASKIIIAGFDFTTYSENTARILANSISFIMASKSKREKIHASVRTGTIAPGDSVNVHINIDHYFPVPGNNTVHVHVHSNDTLHPDLNIPVHILLQNAPEILLGSNCITFDSTAITAANTDSVLIINHDCDTLRISSITSNLPEFIPAISALNIPPRDSVYLSVIFTPDAIQSFNGTLSFLSNAHDTSICLIGSGLPQNILPVVLPAFQQNCRSFQFTDNSINDFGTRNWDFGDGASDTSQNPVHVYNAAGIYAVTLSEFNYYSISTDSIFNIETDTLIASLSYTGLLSQGQPIQLICNQPNMLQYYWTFGDSTTAYSSGSDTTHTYLSLGAFIVTITIIDLQGCTATADTVLNITTGIEQQSQINNINIYPNPFTDETLLSMELPVNGDLTIQLNDIAGKMINEIDKGFHSKGIYRYNLEIKEAGIYTLMIKRNNYQTEKKIIKLR